MAQSQLSIIFFFLCHNMLFSSLRGWLFFISLIEVRSRSRRRSTPRWEAVWADKANVFFWCIQLLPSILLHSCTKCMPPLHALLTLGPLSQMQFSSEAESQVHHRNRLSDSAIVIGTWQTDCNRCASIVNSIAAVSHKAPRKHSISISSSSSLCSWRRILKREALSLTFSPHPNSFFSSPSPYCLTMLSAFLLVNQTDQVTFHFNSFCRDSVSLHLSV